MSRHVRNSLLLLCSIAVTSFVAAAITKSDSKASLGGTNKHIAGEFDLAIPGEFLKITNLDQQQLHATIIVNHAEQIVWRPSNPALATFSIELGDVLNVNVKWFETLTNGSELLLASRTISQLVETRDDFEINPGAYESVGEGYDLDKDGFSNLLERLRGTDPADASNHPAVLSSADDMETGALTRQPLTPLSGL